MVVALRHWDDHSAGRGARNNKPGKQDAVWLSLSRWIRCGRPARARGSILRSCAPSRHRAPTVVASRIAATASATSAHASASGTARDGASQARPQVAGELKPHGRLDARAVDIEPRMKWGACPSQTWASPGAARRSRRARRQPRELHRTVSHLFGHSPVGGPPCHRWSPGRSGKCG